MPGRRRSGKSNRRPSNVRSRPTRARVSSGTRDSTFQSSQTVVISGQSFLNVTGIVPTPSFIDIGDLITTGLVERLASISKTFSLFRCVKLDMQIFGMSTAGFVAVGFAPGDPTIGPSGFSQVTELSNVTVYSSAYVRPVHLSVPRRTLLGDTPLKWYNTDSSVPQGVIFFSSSVAGPVTLDVMFRLTVEFTSPSATGAELIHHGSGTLVIYRNPSSDFFPVNGVTVIEEEPDLKEIVSRYPIESKSHAKPQSLSRQPSKL